MSNKKKKLDDAYEEYKASWEHDAHLDFDQALAEHRQTLDPVQITFNGKTFTLPPSMPLSVWTYLQRHGDGEGNIPDDKAYEFVRLVLGQEFLEELDETGADLAFVMETVIPAVTRKWQAPKKKSSGTDKASARKR